jgi:hypothetical protein
MFPALHTRSSRKQRQGAATSQLVTLADAATLSYKHYLQILQNDKVKDNDNGTTAQRKQ